MNSNETTRTLGSIFTDPAQLMGLLSNPGKAGMDIYRALSNKDKQYVAFAAGVGLIAYGFYLSKKQGR